MLITDRHLTPMPSESLGNGFALDFSIFRDNSYGTTYPRHFGQ